MAIRGWATGAVWRDQGSSLTVAAAASATVLTVEDITDFDTDGGTLEINGQRVDYVAVDDMLDTVTLTSGLVEPAAVDDAVVVVSGGEVAREFILFVSHGEGDEAEVEIPFAQRDMWPERDYNPPVQVILSDDLERIVEVPGRTPQRDAVFTYYPSISAYKGTSSPTVHNAWTTITGWSIVRSDRIDYDPATGIFRVLLDGEYDLRPGVTFESNSTNNRGLRMRYYDADGVDVGVSREVRHPSDGATSLETSQYRGLRAGEGVSFETWQNSGATLDVRGSNALVAPPLTDCAIRWVGPL